MIMTKRKTEKVEMRVTPEQKAQMLFLANACGFEGNLSKLLKEALVTYTWEKYSMDIEKAKEITRIIQL